ncbi:ribosomal protein L21-like protein [Syncephalis fuscata]|nr:ribosomal protein L21-like protein [Syncephalis fuscata]
MWSRLATVARSRAWTTAMPATRSMSPNLLTLRPISTASIIPLYTTNTQPAIPPIEPVATAISNTPTVLTGTATSTTDTAIADIPQDIQQAAQLLREQKEHYAVAEIMGRSFLVTKNDIVVVDRLRNAKVGDILELDRIREIGTMDYTLFGKPLVDSRIIRVRATVIEEPKGSQVIKIKFKKRKNYHRRLRYRHHYTLLRISEVQVMPKSS